MFLKRFVFVNWGNIPNLEFELGPVNLFSGGNGSGKTTGADAIQTVMTAAHENLFQYNPGQDETTQRGRGGKRVRTLASYVLGCDDGSYARLEPSDGYLAAVFHPTKGEPGNPFSALIGVRAWLDTSGRNTVARQDELVFLILPEEQLALGDLIQERPDGRHILPLDQLQTQLIRRFGQRHVEKYDSKKAYLRRLYGALRGRADAVTEAEAVAAARAFSRFMAYKPVQGIDRFVADEILERHDLGEAIRSISSQLKTIHGMEREAAKLVQSIATLEQAREQGQGYIEHWIELNRLDYRQAQQAYLARQQEYLAASREREQQRRDLGATQSEIELTGQRTAQLHDQLVSLEAQRMGIAALREKDRMEHDRAALDRRLVEQARELLEQDGRLRRNQAHSRQILSHITGPELSAELPQAADLQGLDLARRIGEQVSDTGLDLPALLQRDLSGDLADLEAHLEQAWALQRLHNQWHGHWQGADAQGESLRERLARLRHQREERYRQLEEQRRRKQQEIERLRGRQVSYPPYVERALAALREQSPEADPRVLCDHVEVRDPRWQAAIEGYLGGARFSILVEPDYEAEAIRVVRRLPGRDNRARIVQGDQARRDAERSQLHPDSIVHVLEFTHAVARHYLTASYGSLLRVDSAEQLRHARRGLTADGMGSGNYSMYRCDLPDAELVFGAAARERALAAKQAELEGLETDWQTANDRMQQAAALLQAVDGLAPLSYAEGLAGMLESRRELQRLENLLSQLDLGEFEDIEQRLQELRRNESELNTRQAELNQRLGELRGLLEASETRCDRLSRLQEETGAQADRDEANLRAIAGVWPSLDPEPLLARAEREAKDLDAAACAAERNAAEAGLRACERALSQTLEAHNQRCRPGDAIVYQGFEGAYDDHLFRHICGLRQDIDRVYNLLRNNILVDKHAQLRQLKESFNHAFVSHLCHAIYQAIGDGKRQIELLNRELQHHCFGSDRETFRFASEWIPEYRDYARFFEEVVRSPGLGDDQTLFETELSERSQGVLNQLMAMLLDDDEHKAMRELERIADYRNYRRYEIYKEVEGKPPIALSEYGTGSGGQLETPAYIIRSAAITSAFRFAQGQTHLRMVLVDEAFSKMDEARSREVIGYLTESLGLQLIFIMPSNKCGPYMDLISNEFVFAKCPSDRPRGQLQTRVLVDRKQCNPERIRDLWAQHRRTVYQQAELDFMEEFG